MIYILFAAYNEAPVIPSFLEGIRSVMEAEGHDYAIIACTDASTDDTAHVISKYSGEMTIHLIPQIQERGLGVAFRRALQEVCERSTDDADIAVYMDADCTCDPHYSKQLINEVRKGSDVVIASRYAKGGGVIGLPIHRYVLSHGAAWLYHTFFPIPNVREYTCSYRAYSLPILKKAQQAFPNALISETDFCCMPEILIKLNAVGAIFHEIPFILNCTERIGESKMRIMRLIIATLRMCYKLQKIQKSFYLK